MNTSMRKLLSILLALLTTNVFAYEDPNLFKDVDPKFVELKIVEPKQLVGYTVGDIIDRHIILTINEPYRLIEESLPIVGYEKKYRGELLGMTLQEIKFNKKDSEKSITYEIFLKYQIFTNNVVAKPAFITADYYRLINPKDPDNIVKFRIPELTVATSPIAIFGAVKVEDNMSSFRGPLEIGTDTLIKKIRYGIVGLLLSCLSLLYIYSRYTWLPKQNRIFSHIYRQHKKITVDESGIKKIIIALHGGFNETINQTLFIKNKHQLFKKNSNFKNIESEINDFFELSRALYFEKKLNMNSSETYAWLISFTLHCRMCERRLIVDAGDIKKLGLK